MEDAPTAAERARRRVAQLPAGTFFLGLLFLYLGVALFAPLASAGPVDLVTLSWWSQLGVYLLPALALLWGWNLRAGPLLRMRQGLRPAAFAATLLASLANFLIGIGLLALSSALLPDSLPRDYTDRVLGVETGLRQGLIIAAVVFGAPLFEEISFRGMIQQPLTARAGPLFGITVTALLFSGLHFDPVGFFPRWELGLFFGWVVWRTGSLWAGVLAHAVNNGASTLLFLTLSPAAASELEQPTAGHGLALVAFGAAFLIPALYALVKLFPRPGPTQWEAACQPLDPTLPPGRPALAAALRPLGFTLAALALFAGLWLAVVPGPPVEPGASPDASAGHEAPARPSRD